MKRCLSLAALLFFSLPACAPSVSDEPCCSPEDPPPSSPEPTKKTEEPNAPDLPHETIKAVDMNTDRPDGKGKFDFRNSVPSIDGNYMVFTTNFNDGRDAIWSVNLATKKITKLAGLETTVPDGEGNFTNFQDGYSAHGLAPVARGGRVLFWGKDSGTIGYRGGLYSVPVAGGAITRVANKKTILPDFGPLDLIVHTDWGFSIEGDNVAFMGGYSGHFGIYRTTFDGNGITRIMDDQHPVKPDHGISGVPVVHGDHVSFYAQTGFDAVSGPNALFTCSLGGGGCQEVANEKTALLGNTHSPAHTRMQELRMNGDTVVFQADDANDTTNEFHGVYQANGGGLQTVFTTEDKTLPGMYDTLVATRTVNVAADAGTIAMVAFQRVGKQAAYYKIDATTGARTRILGVDDTIDGHTILGVGYLSPTGTSKGRVAMYFSNYDWYALYASP